ncbi:MAG TPA: hypothetical protein VMB71_10745 [Acetobacteraceae bacterium]|nr:hypothetical protein [Acetobacteraceae bacterium]
MIRLALAFVLAAGAADAATRHMSVPGTSLTIDSPCARQVIVDPDPAYPNDIVLEATADHEEETDLLVLTGGDEPRLRVQDQDHCWRPDFGLDFHPTLVITLHVPPKSPIKIDESGASTYRLGAIGGPLSFDLSGAVNLQAADITTLDASISGTGQVRIAHADGNLTADLSGTGGIELSDAMIPEASLDISGMGGFHLADGSIGKLKLSSSGTAAVTIGGTVGDASLEISGVGKVSIAKLTGSLSKDISGMGDVVIGNQTNR